MWKVMTLLVCAVALTTAGCGNSGEKGKNKDKDVPKAAPAGDTTPAN